jgi:hypothetical protein
VCVCVCACVCVCVWSSISTFGSKETAQSRAERCIATVVTEKREENSGGLKTEREREGARGGGGWSDRVRVASEGTHTCMIGRPEFCSRRRGIMCQVWQMAKRSNVLPIQQESCAMPQCECVSVKLSVSPATTSWPCSFFYMCFYRCMQ